MLNTPQANVLISSDTPPRARLADFGLNAIMFDVFAMSKTSVNWTAPEIFVPGERDFRPTFASDIYALGMLIYEVTHPPAVFFGSDRRLSSAGSHRTFPILLQKLQSRIGLPSRSGEQATASSTRFQEVGNH